MDYQNDFNEVAKPPFYQKIIFFNPLASSKYKAPLSFHQTIQRCENFVIVGTKPYHGGFNTAFNIFSAVNYADSSHFDSDRLISRASSTDSLEIR